MSEEKALCGIAALTCYVIATGCLGRYAFISEWADLSIVWMWLLLFWGTVAGVLFWKLK